VFQQFLINRIPIRGRRSASPNSHSVDNQDLLGDTLATCYLATLWHQTASDRNQPSRRSAQNLIAAWV
jgi:hypothetical protein